MRSHRSEPVDASAVELAASLIGQADALIVAAGAGMGVDSGLQDFRGKDGFWRAYPALREAQIDFPDIASPAAFQSSPWRWSCLELLSWARWRAMFGRIWRSIAPDFRPFMGALYFL